MRLTDEQLKAVAPRITRLVTANAGSGKTHVLIGRVSRLLLSGVEPEDILCLTYTKAAASEMQSRLFDSLGKWSVMDNDQLRREIQYIFEKDIDQLSPPIDYDLARQLFAKALETPEGLKVQTIHAFCERILSRFPIEAGIMPGFEPMEDEAQRELKIEIAQDIIKTAAEPGHADLTRAMRCLTSARADMTISSLFDWMAASPEKIHLWQKAKGTEPLAKRLGLENYPESKDIATDFWQSIDQGILKNFLSVLQTCPSTWNDRTAKGIEAALSHTNPEQAFKKLSKTLLNDKGKVSSQICTKVPGEDFKSEITQFAASVSDIENTYRSAVVLELTHAVYIIAQDYAGRYKRRKHEKRALDFNDQILLVRDLLRKSEVADWVTYKLDGGIEHILVDEAQDTSPEQWQIIDKLAEPFFAGKAQDRDGKPPRTLFAVGDEKQSIYSFQGADPQQFLDKIQYYERLTDMGEVRMRTSFRSVQDVLNMVDRVLIEKGALQAMFPAEDYPPASDIARHKAFRDDRGCVELWPIMPKPDELAENPAWDTSPVDAEGNHHQRMKLAKQIAETIRDWINQKEPVFDRKLKKTRPVHAGDILILVQRRNSFFDAIIRELKKAGVPVAGADRLKLKDALIVKDLISLARFILLPSDDLSLAEVLKSPLVGMDDEALFKVAVDREGHLWDALKDRKPDVAGLLADIMQDGQTLPPYDFYAATLDRTDADGVSLRAKFYRRLTMEAREALEAFLARALDHQYRRNAGLHHFVKDFAENDVEIKRDMDAATGLTRVMTVHGAKGLEAPIVFLPDTTSLPSDKDILIPFEDGFVWKASSKEKPDALEPVYDANKQRMMQEQLRLLYVAMTRAESRLIICGYHNGSGETGYADGTGSNPYRSWYGWLSDAFEGLSVETFDLPGAAPGQAEARRHGTLPEAVQTEPDLRQDTNIEVPGWTDLSPAPETGRTFHSPSRLLAEESFSPLMAADMRGGRLRGTVIHKLLEVLPDFPPERREEIAKKIMAGYGAQIKGAAPDIYSEVKTVLEHPDLADMFAVLSRSEVALTGTAETLPEGLWLNAQIDRLCVTERDVLIVDYKSDRHPPEDETQIALTYRLQMAAYRALAEEIYPDKTVSCALLWTAAPRLMPLSKALLDEALQSLHTLPKSELTF